MELPGYTVVVPFAQKWGRTPTVSSSFFVAGTSLVAVACLPNGNNSVIQ
jgi:hypothetical protein